MVARGPEESFGLALASSAYAAVLALAVSDGRELWRAYNTGPHVASRKRLAAACSRTARKPRSVGHRCAGTETRLADADARPNARAEGFRRSDGLLAESALRLNPKSAVKRQSACRMPNTNQVTARTAHPHRDRAVCDRRALVYLSAGVASTARPVGRDSSGRLHSAHLPRA